MLSFAGRIQKSASNPWPKYIIHSHVLQLRFARTDSGSSPSHNRRRSKFSPSNLLKKAEEDKSEWWAVDGEMHEIGDNVPPRERFVIPRENIPNKRRKQLREQFMRRTRLVLKESVSSPSLVSFHSFFNIVSVENLHYLYLGQYKVCFFFNFD